MVEVLAYASVLVGGGLVWAATVAGERTAHRRIPARVAVARLTGAALAGLVGTVLFIVGLTLLIGRVG